MADVTDDDADGTSHYKLVLLSAHDTSVIPYVDALLGSNGPKDLWAPYASYVTLELYKVRNICFNVRCRPPITIFEVKSHAPPYTLTISNISHTSDHDP